MPALGRKRQKREKKPTGVLNNVMLENQKGCKKNNRRAEEEQTTATRTKQRRQRIDQHKAGGERKNIGNPERNTASSTKQARQHVSVLPLLLSPH